MKDPVARQRAENAHDRLDGQDARIRELQELVQKVDAPPVITATYEPAQTGTITVENSGPNALWAPLTLQQDRAAGAVRVAVLTIVLCYENLRDALQFDTWGGLQDATSLDERAQVLRGWLGTATDEELAAATACYDELAGT